MDPPGGERRDFIVRTGWNMLCPETGEGAPFERIAHLKQMKAQAPEQPREWTVRAAYGRSKQNKHLPLRLLILPSPVEKVPAAVKGQTRRQGASVGCIPTSSSLC